LEPVRRISYEDLRVSRSQIQYMDDPRAIAPGPREQGFEDATRDGGYLCFFSEQAIEIALLPAPASFLQGEIGA
jgi:hypothetical protein